MSLPALTVPGTAPPLQAAGHAIDPGDVYDNVARAMGANRKRRVFTIQNRTVAVEWFLEQPVMEAVWAWFERGLDVGARPFAAPVAAEGAGIRWWTAKWKAPFQSDPVDLGDRMAWRVSGALVLSGEGEESFAAAFDLAAEVRVELNASAIVIAAFDLATEVRVELGIASTLFAEVAVALNASGGLIVASDLAAEVAAALDASGTIGSGTPVTDILATQIFGG